jgi:DNA-binding NtrC family response regulator
MTAYAAHDLIVEAEREGVVQVMSKPVNIPLLLGTMTHALNRDQSVLVIDHDAAFLRTLSDVLRLNGFAAVLADDLDQARRAVVQHQPVAVLLHMHLGNATPRDAVLAVHEVNPAVALILYSGHADGAQEVRRTLPTDWIHGYLQKPFDVDQITGMLDAIRSNG